MPASLGTRVNQTARRERIDQGDETRTHSADPGLASLVTASLTFGSGNVSAANGTFSGFTIAVPFPVLIEGVNLNNGYFTVTAVDGTNQAFLTLDPPPATEGPLSGTVRTA